MHLTALSELIFELIPLLDHEFVKPVDIKFRSTISQTQVNILAALKKHDMTMKELSESMTISKQQMTILVDKLVNKKYTIRKTSAEDRRIIIIAITPAGLELLEKLRSFTLSILKEKMNTMNHDDQEAIAQAASQLHRVLTKYK
ncbi:MAG: MarR family transcriptional regulator [Megasphaera sp.]|jgi:DNA-binding MarR family transcriptional regulator|nr:MarR family transcriptional regulator [Megasphaera sp.]MCI1248604.1 MarR family transcriptional regulator [Megasphaera sp.]